MIPKIIHQTWKTNKIPDEWKDAVKTCKSINTDFKYILWTDKTMDKFVKNIIHIFIKHIIHINIIFKDVMFLDI